MKTTSKILLVLMLLAMSASPAWAQRSVMLPEKIEKVVMQIDAVFHDMDQFRNAYDEKRSGLMQSVRSYRMMADNAHSSTDLHRYYVAMMRKKEAEVFLLDYTYFQQVSRSAGRAMEYARAVMDDVHGHDYGKAMIENVMRDLEHNITDSGYRIRNLGIIQEHGDLTDREIMQLARDTAWQRELIQHWIGEKRWYSELLQRAESQRGSFSHMTDFAQHILDEARSYRNRAEVRMAEIQLHVAELRRQALLRLG